MAKAKKTKYPGIKRLGPNEFHVRVTVIDPVTKRRREGHQLLVGVSEGAALEAHQEILKELRAGKARLLPQTASGVMLGDYVEQWLNHRRKTGKCRAPTIKRKIDSIARFVTPILGNVPLDQIDRRWLGVWMEEVGMMKQPDGSRFAHNTLLTAWSNLRAMLRNAMNKGDLRVDPTQGVKFEVKGVPARPKTSLTKEQLGGLLKGTEGLSLDVRAMIWVLFTTGARFCEVSALVWKDVDLEGGTIHIERSQVDGCVGPPKTPASQRLLPLPVEVTAMLRELHHRQQENVVRTVDEGMVFPASNGKYRNPAMLTKPLREAAKLAGITGAVSAHTARRTVNNLIRQTVGEVAARGMTGHTTPAMTDRYSHVPLPENRENQTVSLPDLSKVLSSGGGVRAAKSGVESGVGAAEVELTVSVA